MSSMERSALLKEAEEDAIIFATTVGALVEFISGIDESTNELSMCLSFADRTVRDMMVLSIRSMVCLPPSLTHPERMKIAFPWLATANNNSR